jgi:ribose transport system substrate-binding protein
VVAFDATTAAIDMLKKNTVDMVIAQKPGDMGYLAVEMAMAYFEGVSSIPSAMSTGYAIITRDNVDKPEIAKFIYTQ